MLRDESGLQLPGLRVVLARPEGCGVLENWESGKLRELGRGSDGMRDRWAGGEGQGSGDLENWNSGILGSWGTEGATGQLPGRRGNYRRRNYGGGTAGDNAGKQRSGCDREAFGNQFRFMFLIVIFLTSSGGIKIPYKNNQRSCFINIYVTT